VETLYFQTLIAVAELGSFSRAAEQLHLTQSTVSRRIAALEERYGQVLLARDGTKIVPTEAGRLAIEKAHHIVTNEHQLSEALARHKMPTHLKIGCSSNFASIHLVRLLAHVEHLELSQHVTSSVAATDEIVHGIECGRYDVIFLEHCGLPALERFATKDLTEDVVVFLSSHTKLPAGEVDIEELLPHQIYCCPTCCCTRRLLDKNLKSIGLEISNFSRVIDIGDIHVMRDSLVHRGGVAFLSQELVAAELAAGQLVAHTVAGFVHKRRRTIVARDRHTVDAWHSHYLAASSAT